MGSHSVSMDRCGPREQSDQPFMWTKKHANGGKTAMGETSARSIHELYQTPFASDSRSPRISLQYFPKRGARGRHVTERSYDNPGVGLPGGPGAHAVIRAAPTNRARLDAVGHRLDAGTTVGPRQD